MNEEKVRIRLYSTEDNKLWFEIDNSFNLNEAETVHKETAQQDMQNIVQPFFNDLRDNFSGDVPTVSKILGLITNLTEQSLETAKDLNAVVKLMGLSNTEPKENIEDDFEADYFG